RPAEDWPDVRLSPGGRWLVVTESQGWAKSEVFFQDRQREGAGFVPLAEGVHALFGVTARDDRFYVLTNDGAPRFRLFLVDPLRPARPEWHAIIPEGPDVLEGVASVSDHLFALFTRRASSRLRWYDREGRPL